ncbi:MAG: site-specific DNA-methyltransferase [Spirochaetes bacterium]|nr:MAG: site-specific DNA-methyltransferase [Spirochaetota bacterium]
MTFVHPVDCYDFIDSLEDKSVSLLLTDPPYMGIVEDSWDNQWANVDAYVDWMYTLFAKAKPKLTDTGSLIFFGGIGKHGERPFFKLMEKLESNNLFTYRNMITWKKRRAYGKSHDYLFCREEIAWYSVSSQRTEVTFNIPLLDVKRGYDGWNEKYKAKSEFKRVSNVWDDIPEIFRPARNTQKPLLLMNRLVKTHSNPGDLVVDPFTGWGSTGVSALALGRRFQGSEKIPEDAAKADERCAIAAKAFSG